jgi:hypothetical protein
MLSISEQTLHVYKGRKEKNVKSFLDNHFFPSIIIPGAFVKREREIILRLKFPIILTTCILMEINFELRYTHAFSTFNENSYKTGRKGTLKGFATNFYPKMKGLWEVYRIHEFNFAFATKSNAVNFFFCTK